jgi:hypothetical protein
MWVGDHAGAQGPIALHQLPHTAPRTPFHLAPDTPLLHVAF